MLKTKAIRKIFTTTLTMFIILTLLTIPTTTKNNVLRTNLEIEDITNLPTNSIYLLNKDNLLVKTNVYIEGNNLENKIKSIISYLTIENEKRKSTLKGYLPKEVKLLAIKNTNNHIILNFNKAFKNINKSLEEQIITGITHSILGLKDIKTVTIQVENEPLPKYQFPLDKTTGINNEYLLTNRKDLTKVTVFYLDETKENYLPITKYLNDKRDKIEIIIDELKNNSTEKRISYLNSNLELIDYKEENNVLFLNFNEYLKDNNSKISDVTYNLIAESVFFNYDINMVMFEINNQEEKSISRFK